MTRVDSDAWNDKALSRKAFRDHCRAKFYREVGMKTGADVQSISGAPQERSSMAQSLLEVTSKGGLCDAKQTVVIGLAAAALQGLGQTGMGSIAANQQDLSQFTIRKLRETWFQSPVFFD